MTIVDPGARIDATGPAYDAAAAAFAEAWDVTEPVELGVGGSIRFIAEFLEAFPRGQRASHLRRGPPTSAHGANQALQLAGFEWVVLAPALLLARLAQG